MTTCACTGDCRRYGSCNGGPSSGIRYRDSLAPMVPPMPFPDQKPYEEPGFGTRRWPTYDEVEKLLGGQTRRVDAEVLGPFLPFLSASTIVPSSWPAPPRNTDATLDVMT